MSVQVQEVLQSQPRLRRLYEAIGEVIVRTGGYEPVSDAPFLIYRDGSLCDNARSDSSYFGCPYSEPHDLAVELLYISYLISENRYEKVEVEFLESWGGALATALMEMLEELDETPPPATHKHWYN